MMSALDDIGSPDGRLRWLESSRAAWPRIMPPVRWRIWCQA